MKERLLVLALAAGALALFYVFFVPKPKLEAFGAPLSTESRPEGYQALWRWLEEQHIPSSSLRNRYERLSSLVPQASGNLLIVTLPQSTAADAEELKHLKEWVQAGNTLLILAAVDDLPPWAWTRDFNAMLDKVKLLTGLKPGARDDSSNKDKKQDKGTDKNKEPEKAAEQASSVEEFAKLMTTGFRVEMQPRGPHPLLAGVQRIMAISPVPTHHGPPAGRNERLPLELAERTDSREATLWLLRSGSGQILLSSVASPFNNGAAALADNARLFANIVAWSRTGRGAVVFDDAHQGAMAYYDGKAFFADSRLHRSLLWILVLWLAFVLGALPLRAAQRQHTPLDETVYIEASARYFAAVVPPYAAAQQLIERFLEGLRSASGADGRPLWEPFDADPRVSAGQRRILHTLYERACSRRKVDLAHLQNLLAQLKGILE